MARALATDGKSSHPDPIDAARAIEVTETHGAVLLRYRGEGEDADVEFTERAILIRAPADAAAGERQDGTWRGRGGEVLRRLPLSAPVDAAHARATVCDGVFTLRVPTQRAAERP
jgi:hypothetical protein